MIALQEEALLCFV